MGASISSRRRRGNEESNGPRRRASLESESGGDESLSPRRHGSGVRRRSSNSLFRGSSRSLQGSAGGEESVRYSSSSQRGSISADSAFMTPPESPGAESPPLHWTADAGRTVYLSDETDAPPLPQVESPAADHHGPQQPVQVPSDLESPPRMPSSAQLSRSHLQAFRELNYPATPSRTFRQPSSMLVGPDEGFTPDTSLDFEWMGRSMETLLFGHLSGAPVLALPAEDITEASSWFYGSRGFATESSIRRSSDGTNSAFGNQLRSLHVPMRHDSRTRVYCESQQRQCPSNEGRRYASSTNRNLKDRARLAQNDTKGGPNVVLSLLAREVTGIPSFSRFEPSGNKLRAVGGQTLFSALDKPSSGMVSETVLLGEAIDNGDWAETQIIVSRLAPRLIGDPSIASHSHDRGRSIDDPSLPAWASPYRAGGGRLGLERETFVLSGGVELFTRIFREPAFVGPELLQTNDARHLSEDMVSTKLSSCWNEILASLRELTYSLPEIVDNGSILERGNFLPFLFTLLSHDTCFDGAATLIEEILSFQSQAPPSPPPSSGDGDDHVPSTVEYSARAVGHVSPATTFFLGNVPNLYELWGNFSCRQLAHFCRILALLVFEPEDRLLLESPAVLKSVELLQLRRDRAARCGRDAAVDMNQAILLGDADLMQKLLKLLRVMNFSPSLHRSSAYHVMAHFPVIADALVMLGLTELEDWREISRLEHLARKMLADETHSGTVGSNEAPSLCDLGSIADMLESLSGLLRGNPLEPATQLGHIIRVVNAAQQAGVVVGRQTQQRARRATQSGNANPERGTSSLDSTVAVADHGLSQNMYSNSSEAIANDLDSNTTQVGIGVDGQLGGPTMHTLHAGGRGRVRINTPEDAANELQFNALLLAPYQVEVLFVLCTLLGGRRKIDTQRRLNEWGLIPILDDMFHRLSWGHASESHRSSSAVSRDRGDGSSSNDVNDAQQEAEAPTGIHGPGCECNPESALRVQYLRLLHNFCDRDCDNYSGRRLLLSAPERDYIFSGRSVQVNRAHIKPGLFSKILAAFIGEPDDSPYRFWLASCAESYLRGSSPQEQVFAAQSGLLEFLVEVIISDRLHCAGSLQTAFDLLGELCKGNPEILRLLIGDFEEEDFRRLMSIAAANLVDSNVFLRSLLLSVERIAASRQQKQLHCNPDGHFTFGDRHDLQTYANNLSEDGVHRWISARGTFSRTYLTHSWWDSTLDEVPHEDYSSRNLSGLGSVFQARGRANDIAEQVEIEGESDESRPSDWFPAHPHRNSFGSIGDPEATWLVRSRPEADYLNDSVGHYGWVFSPSTTSDRCSSSPWGLSEATFSPNSFERLSWFLAANQTRLLRDLLGVVDLINVNHENICCLNTAVVVAIFAHRRQQLPRLVQELRHMNLEEKRRSERTSRRGSARSSHGARESSAADSLGNTFVEAMKMLDMEDQGDGIHHSLGSNADDGHDRHTRTTIGDRTDVLRNFRELLWFWSEYYTHRGRDRLSLEFSSHLRFHEWKNVVSLLCADDGSACSLVQSPVRLPTSPYRRAARIVDNRLRGY